ncbi:MAG: DUF4149 domain-containing protein [Gammaproteobacteria bacterium]|nr:DUF4149 domain-containing protein [Gammaproteobacteria bacterium]MDH5800462.1 DUF4149 domain-containing protein [Gammaproteobacteria bacterium]
MKFLEAIHDVALVFWIGGLWSIGYLSAPVLFSVLDSRQLAGQVAGRQFELIAIVGFVCATVLLASLWVRCGKVWQLWLVLTMLVLVSVGFFGLQPMMQELKAMGITPGSEQATAFGRLHGISSLLYLLTSVMGLVLVIKPANPKRV